MTNSNTTHAILNALNEFESYGLDTGATYNEILKSFDQLRGDINTALDSETAKTDSDFNEFVNTISNNSTGENIELLDSIETKINSFSSEFEHKKYTYLLTHFRQSIRFHIASIIGGFVRDNVESFTNHDTDIFRFFNTTNTDSKSVQLIDIISDTFENEKRELYYYSR